MRWTNTNISIYKGNQMKISVIVPVYNVEKYLGECIDSVRAQTMTDWELILVNDGSPDNSDKICRDYASRDSRIKYIVQENAGVSAARNNGMKHATGDYLFFLDSDDAICPIFLEHAYNNAIGENADIVILGADFQKRLPVPPAMPGWGMLIRHKLLEQHPDIIFPVGIQPCEDGLFSHQLIAVAKTISFVPDVEYFYRQHDAQNHTQINKTCGKVLEQIPQWFEILIKFYNKYNLWDTRALHLAKFIEHEPFEFRYIDMPFTPEQHEQLFHIIHAFYAKHVKKRLSNKDWLSLSNPFKIFLRSSSAKSFQRHMCFYKPLKRFKRHIKELFSNT